MGEEVDIMIEKFGHDPVLFAGLVILYCIWYVATTYMGYYGISWYLRKKHKKVKKNRTLL